MECVKEPACCRCKSALHAVQRGHTKCLKYFLKTSTEDPNKNITIEKNIKEEWVSEDEDGEQYMHTKITQNTIFVNATLLHLACKKGYGDCVTILLKDERVDPNKLVCQQSALYMMCGRRYNIKFDSNRIILLLLKNPRVKVGKSFLCYMSSYEYNVTENVLDAFLQKGEDIDIVFKSMCYSPYNFNRTLEHIKQMLLSHKVSETILWEIAEYLKNKNDTNYDKRLSVIEEYINSLPVIKEPGIQ